MICIDTAFSHPDFKLNEQQEAVIESFKYFGGEWLSAYQLVGFKIDGVTIGDAGRRMRVLREEGILDSPSDFLYN